MLRELTGVRRLAPGLLAVTLLAISLGAVAAAAEPAPAAPASAKPAEQPAEKPAAGKPGKPSEPAAGPAATGAVESRAARSGDAAAARGAEGDKSAGAAGPEGTSSTAPGRGLVKRAAPAARKKSTPAPPGDEPPGLSTPPLDISGLRAEVRREAPPAVGIDPPELPETRVEKMLADVAKARESLHDDTRKLEALLAAENGGGGEGEAGAAATGGKPGAKNPLDILAKALRGIKPDQAAPIVSRLDRHLGAVVLQRMPPADAGKILGAMKPETAADLATLIALHRPVADARGAEGKR